MLNKYENCEKAPGGIYDKAAVLIREIIQAHPFASGNRRTAVLVAKDFLMANKARINIPDDISQAKVFQGIRENFYTHKEIKDWMEHGKIKPFKR